MRVAFAGCWHADTATGIRAIEYLHSVGVSTIVHTGDFLYTHPTTDRFLHVINRELAKRGMNIIVVRGNHDNPGILKKATLNTPTNLDHPFTLLKEHIFHAPDGTIWEWEDIKFAALGGARSVDWSVRKPGKEWWADEISEPEAIEKLKQERFDVLITHDVPAGIPLWFIDRNETPRWWDIQGAEEHRKGLADVVEAARPELVVSGHMHARQEAEVTTDSGYTYQSIILDRGDYTVHSRRSQQSIHEANLWIVDLHANAITTVE